MSNRDTSHQADNQHIFNYLHGLYRIDMAGFSVQLVDRHLPCPPSGTYWERWGPEGPGIGGRGGRADLRVDGVRDVGCLEGC